MFSLHSPTSAFFVHSQCFVLICILFTFVQSVARLDHFLQHFKTQQFESKLIILSSTKMKIMAIFNLWEIFCRFLSIKIEWVEVLIGSALPDIFMRKVHTIRHLLSQWNKIFQNRLELEFIFRLKFIDFLPDFQLSNATLKKLASEQFFN